jgi:nucleotide-binding universal stress UspA family protein
MYDRILVPTDGSDCSDAAVTHAIDLAAQYDAELHVLFVADTRDAGHGAPAISADQLERAMSDHGEEVTSRVAERTRAEGVETVTAVRSGIPDDEIRAYAEDEGCDLVVMGTHGRTGIERYLLGSVTERTVRQSPVPVLTVRAEE